MCGCVWLLKANNLVLLIQLYFVNKQRIFGEILEITEWEAVVASGDNVRVARFAMPRILVRPIGASHKRLC